MLKSSRPPAAISRPALALSRPPASRSTADTRAAKRQDTVGKAVFVDGDDAAAVPDEDRQRWQHIVVTCRDSWCDEDFPAMQISIDGKEAPTPAPAPALGSMPQCRCQRPSKKSVVASDTANKGRPYFHCSTRACGFFVWADGDGNFGRSSGQNQPHGWSRFPHLPVVSDFGFRATDLRQGGVGDCWFMSALSVVAERHDLVARLFAEDMTAVNKAGCYCLRFFLDGRWTSVFVDDQLPITSSARRPGLAAAGEHMLAFSRCGDGLAPTGGRTASLCACCHVCSVSIGFL